MGHEREPGPRDSHGEGGTEKAAQEGGTWLRTQEPLGEAGTGESSGLPCPSWSRDRGKAVLFWRPPLPLLLMGVLVLLGPAPPSVPAVVKVAFYRVPPLRGSQRSSDRRGRYRLSDACHVCLCGSCVGIDGLLFRHVTLPTPSTKRRIYKKY